jgi:hypothetical protein
MFEPVSRFRRPLTGLVLAGAVALPLVAAPSAAHAYRGGYGFGPGLAVGTVLGLGAAAAVAGAYAAPPVVYAPPPVVYAPPPVLYAPPPPAYYAPPPPAAYYPPPVYRPY